MPLPCIYCFFSSQFVKNAAIIYHIHFVYNCVFFKLFMGQGILLERKKTNLVMLAKEIKTCDLSITPNRETSTRSDAD